MTRGVGAQLPGDGQVPLAPVLHADQTAATVMIVLLYGGFAATVAWAAFKLLRERDGVPAILVVAGVISANIEPLGDHVGFIVYAPDIPWFDYTILGRQMPSFIAVAEASYVAMGSYYAYRMLLSGRSLRAIALVSAVLVGIPEIVVEMLWHHWGMIAYYGENPTRLLGIPLYSIVQNCALLPVYGVATFFALELLRGARRWWLLIITPTVTIGYVVGVSWPVYLAVGSSAPAWVVWLAAAWVMVASVAVAWLALSAPPLVRLRESRVTPEPRPVPVAA